MVPWRRLRPNVGWVASSATVLISIVVGNPFVPNLFPNPPQAARRYRGMYTLIDQRGPAYYAEIVPQPFYQHVWTVPPGYRWTSVIRGFISPTNPPIATAPLPPVPVIYDVGDARYAPIADADARYAPIVLST